MSQGYINREMFDKVTEDYLNVVECLFKFKPFKEERFNEDIKSRKYP